MSIKKVIISRTDNLGDVMLTLSMAGILKSQIPGVTIYFLGKPYTQPIIEKCTFVDVFIDREKIISGEINLADYQADAIIYVFPDKEVSKHGMTAKIPMRIGTSHRFHHWLHCNKLVNFSRTNSSLHESQLNLKLLKPLGIEKEYSLNEIATFTSFQANSTGRDTITNVLGEKKLILVVHPKSKGSAREWPLKNYVTLILSLPKDKFNFLVTGTQVEGEKIKGEIPDFFDKTGAVDLTGKLSLNELITEINDADALLACSTGPLHIAAALGKHALGIYPPIKPMHAGRWAPVGKNTHVFSLEKNCEACRKSGLCVCIEAVEVVEVRNYLLGLASTQVLSEEL